MRAVSYRSARRGRLKIGPDKLDCRAGPTRRLYLVLVRLKRAALPSWKWRVGILLGAAASPKHVIEFPGRASTPIAARRPRLTAPIHPGKIGGGSQRARHDRRPFFRRIDCAGLDRADRHSRSAWNVSPQAHRDANAVRIRRSKKKPGGSDDCRKSHRREALPAAGCDTTYKSVSFAVAPDVSSNGFFWQDDISLVVTLFAAQLKTCVFVRLAADTAGLIRCRIFVAVFVECFIA